MSLIATFHHATSKRTMIRLFRIASVFCAANMITLNYSNRSALVTLLRIVVVVALISMPWASEVRSGPAGGPNAAPVQMLVPGFSVRALPLELRAINAVRYRSDGKLFALGYDGTVYLLSDTNGDGLEDKLTEFYKPKEQILSVGMAVTPPNYTHGQGVIIARKGGLVLEVDTDGDDRADQETVIASNWEVPIRFPGGVSDAIGVAIDQDSFIYFGLGATNSQNGYVLENGISKYRITSERGSIMRISPDFSKREIIATGIRASIGMAVNANGDLFCTDQEGATWMANGNPFDELLHIQAGRHYGFPPRHPKFLPNVIDEPSVFDYGPQHESTCGLQFNESVNGGPIFGPQWWQGDAFVAGESRGKIHRTKLAKTPAGYIGKDQIIARSSWLTIDQCVSPRGDLVLTTHSGSPDWGNGPNAIGRLFKLSLIDFDRPQPVFACRTSPEEMQIIFDRPLSEEAVEACQQSLQLVEGAFVKEGDAYESFRPGYRVVYVQQAAPRHDVPVLSTTVSDDRRSLIIRTPPRLTAKNCSIEFNSQPSQLASKVDCLPQASIIALACDFNGASASWMSSDGAKTWNGWIPHCDLQAAEELSVGSQEHAALWKLIETPGNLTVRFKLDLWSMLRPAVQLGERLSYQLPAERITVVIAGPPGMKVTTSAGRPNTSIEEFAGRTEIHVTSRDQFDWLPVEICMPTGSDQHLQVTWHTAEDNRDRPFAVRRVFLPWAIPNLEPIDVPPPPELKGGNWANGEQLFKQKKCADCHSRGGGGAVVGPDLANLRFREYASVYKDITDPNATINPDFVSFVIETEAGQVLTGVVVEDTKDHILLAGSTGAAVEMNKDQIAEMKASKVSLMPEGLIKDLSPEAVKDLLTYLMVSEPTENSKIGHPQTSPSAATVRTAR